MILHENRLLADDSHEISCLICCFYKRAKFFNCRLLQIKSGALRVNYLPIRFGYRPVKKADLLGVQMLSTARCCVSLIPSRARLSIFGVWRVVLP